MFFKLLALRNSNLSIHFYHHLSADTKLFVISNGEGCAQIGGAMLDKGGSAIDSAIATLLCGGVLLPQSMGLGGGFAATIFGKSTGKIETLMAREIAPCNTHPNMFLNRKIEGAIAAAVPGEIWGYWRLHQKYGNLPWKELFAPSIELCMNGYRISPLVAAVLRLHEQRIRNEPTMAELFINPLTHELYKEQEIMYRPALGATLKAIAEEGPETMYRGGRIGKLLVEDIQACGGIITEDDLMSYEVRWEQPIKAHFTAGYTLYTTPIPTSGPVLAFILNVMEPLYTDAHEVYWHRVIETFKHAYGLRSNLGDSHYEPQVNGINEQLVSRSFAAKIRSLIADDCTYADIRHYGAKYACKEDSGTASIAVLALNGDAISVTSTINNHFGAMVCSRRTGIILNDQMDDFSTPGIINSYGIPASPANFIRPGKRPMSSICPSIVFDKHGVVRLLVGGAGGSKITTSIAQTILRYFVLNEGLDKAIVAGRIHHQLTPLQVDVEPEVPVNIHQHLKRVGHKLNFLSKGKAFSALTVIGFKTGRPLPICDPRRLGCTTLILPSTK